MFIEIATHAAITSAFGAYEHRAELSKIWKKLTYFVKNGKLCILVVGPGGVGKTTLSQFLCRPDLKVLPPKYDESFHIERFSLPGGAVAELVTAPGQKRHINSWEDLFEETKKKKRSFGVINVVAFGYHSTTLEMSEIRQQGETTSAATSRYYGESRAREIEVAQELVERLKRHTSPFWMVTLATKQDLWWRDRKNVERHYKDGKYSESVKALEEAHSATGFRHEYFSVALHSQNIVDSNGTIVTPTAEGYDDAIKYAHQQKLLSILQGFVSPKKS